MSRPHPRRWCDPEPSAVRRWCVYRLMADGRREAKCLLVTTSTEAELVRMLDAPWGYCWEWWK